MNTSFDTTISLLNGLHEQVAMTDQHDIIQIDDERNFLFPEGYNAVVAHVGDVNSQIITFDIPETYEGHNLHECDFKQIIWKNLSDNISGVSNLNKITKEVNGDSYELFEWLIPPQIAQTAGVIELSISCYDLDNSNKIAFAWNTSKNRSLVIGESQTFLGTKNDSIQLPPKNQILLVHDNKQIIAPKEYNNLIGLYGDKGTGKIYFKCKQNIAGIDLLHEDTNIKVLVNFEDATYSNDDIQINMIETNTEFVLLTWSVPDWVTANENEYIGTIKIGLVFTQGDKCWRSASYSSLRIGKSLVKDSDQAAAAPTFEEEVTEIVNDIIENSDEIGRANWEQTNENGKGYIENKPAIKSGIGANSVIENKGSYAGGINSSVCGSSTEAHGDGSRAEGLLSRAYGHHSHAEGMETKAYGYRSHTEGLGTITGSETRPGLNDEGAHAEGIRTHAYGKGTHTEGIESVAEGNGSHAQGGYTHAQYAYSHAEGYGVYTTMQYQHAQGKFNVKDKNNNYAHIVGNGDDNNHRSNAHTLDWDGNAWFAGEVRVGGNSYDASNAVATTQYVDDKVAPIASDVAILFDALGGAIEYASIDSKDNPVTVPSNVFPAATIDKIGCGLIAYENRIINEAIIRGSSLPSYVEEVVDANTCTFKVADGTYTGFDDVIFCTPNGGYINDADTYYFKAEVVSGSFTPSDSDTELCVVDQGNLITVGDPATKLSTSWSYGDVIPLSLFIQGSGSITCTDLVLRVIWGRKLEATGVPVTAVMLNSATVYTVPEQIRALKVRVDEGAGFQNAYGLALSETLYNYLDLENKQYVINCAVGSHPHGGLWTVEHHEIIDVSAYLTDEDGEITVVAGDEILFVDADGNSAGSTVPSTITYIVKKGAS